MTIIQTLLQFLRKPFPEVETRSAFYQNIGGISLFVVLFLFIFQPFGISSVPDNMFLICLGFGLMTFLSCIVFDFGSLVVSRFGTRSKPFTFGKWIANIVGLMLTISLANFLYARSLFGSMRWEFLPDMIYGTFVIGIFPVLILGSLSLLRQEKKYSDIAREISVKVAHESKGNSLSESYLFGISASQIRYVEALQNYVKVAYIDQQGVCNFQTERATLKSILEEIEGGSIVKCHRSFLVNREAIESVSGNAQGLLLTLNGCDKEIPVSRSWISVFKAKE